MATAAERLQRPVDTRRVLLAAAVVAVVAVRDVGAVAGFAVAAPLLLLGQAVVTAAAAVVVGHELRLVQLFGRRPTRRVRLGRVIGLLGRDPLGDWAVTWRPRSDLLWRWRQAPVFVIGPGCTAAVAYLAGESAVTGDGGPALGGAAIAAWWTTLSSLFVRERDVIVQPAFGPGIGLRVLIRFRHDPEAFCREQLHAEYLACTAAGNKDRLLAAVTEFAERTADARYVAYASGLLGDFERWADSRSFALRSLELGLQDDERRAEAHNLVAYADLMLGDDELMDEATSHAESAVALGGGAAALDTLGWVHLRAGRLDEAERRFLQAYDAADVDDARGLVATGLARVARAKGDEAGAARWTEAAARHAERKPPLPIPPIGL